MIQVLGQLLPACSALVTLVGLVALAQALPGRPGPRLAQIAPAALVVAVAALPLPGWTWLRLAAGLGSFVLGVLLAVSARQEQRRRAVTVAAALDGFTEGEARTVVVQGSLAGDPPLLGPVSGAPCLRYRLEAWRTESGEAELIAFDETASERLVLQDSTGRVPLSLAPGLLPREGLIRETVASGRAHASDLWSETPPPDRIAALARAHDPAPAQSGSVEYRFRERTLPDGVAAVARGVIRRVEGELVLVARRVTLGPSPRGLAARTTWLAALACAAAGLMWLGSL